MRNFGRRIMARLPLPARAVEFYDRFEEGVFASVGMRALPGLVIITGLVWATEAMRLYLVVAGPAACRTSTSGSAAPSSSPCPPRS